MSNIEDLLPQKLTIYEGNWTADYPHENGMYMNACISCNNKFLGHKRRMLCRLCTPENVVIVDEERQRGIDINTLASMKVKETEQLVMTLNDSHPHIFKKDKIKKPFWKNGKLRYK